MAASVRVRIGVIGCREDGDLVLDAVAIPPQAALV